MIYTKLIPWRGSITLPVWTHLCVTLSGFFRDFFVTKKNGWRTRRIRNAAIIPLSIRCIGGKIAREWGYDLLKKILGLWRSGL